MEALQRILAVRYGLPFQCKFILEKGYPCVVFRPVGPAPPHSFEVRMIMGWRRLTIKFLPDSYSGELIASMGTIGIEKQNAVRSFTCALINHGGTLEAKINGEPVSQFNREVFGKNWKELTLEYEIVGIEPVREDLAIEGTDLNSIFLSYMGVLIALLPLESVEQVRSYYPFQPAKPEGVPAREEVLRYERSRLNREACLAIKGTKCSVCGLDFREYYGALGYGFIHVHHIVPVSRMGKGYVLNPATDLVPVCPNCHAMLHREDPPLSIEELKELINLQR